MFKETLFRLAAVLRRSILTGRHIKGECGNLQDCSRPTAIARRGRFFYFLYSKIKLGSFLLKVK
ncbi:MAG: hypothetical protein KKD55_00690, partial [Candidatus Omnitrophica bacterium]|nr:hypothetical protein [Candidatus Omnitrophota bacterium]